MDETLDRKLVLEALIKHETLTIDDLSKKENIGVVADKNHLQLLLTELLNSGHLEDLPGVQPLTYTITQKGIEEGVRLRAAEKQ
jgi:predicted ArsR family transcriptional regulator